MQAENFRATALRYRPQIFADLIGQEHVSRTLSNAIQSERIAHAFLFSGPRGVGKTSAARILAKALNCEKGPTPAPCGECASCREITESRSLDVYEIDGASNRGIEQIRDLRESARFAPARDRYKMYIIDEVHMLTTEAFNALLKTLEEPPPSVVFIFATTELAKVKLTIRSRCQQYRFHRISALRIQERLGVIAQADGIAADDEALLLIARAADGSMRDAASLFDQIANYASGTITADHVREMLGTIDSSVYFDFLTFLLEGDIAELLNRVEKLDDEGVDFISFTQGIADVLRDLVMLASGSGSEVLERMPEDAADLKNFLDPSSQDGFSLDDAVRILNLLADVIRELHDAPNPRRIFELGLFRLVKYRSMVQPGEIIHRLESLERRLQGGNLAGESPPANSAMVERRPGPGLPIEFANSKTPPARAAHPQSAPGRPVHPPQARAHAPEAGHSPAVQAVQATRRQPPESAKNAENAAGAESGQDGACLDLVREYARMVDHENPFLSRVLLEVVGAEIVGNILLFWLLPKSNFHRSSIMNYSAQILTHFDAKLRAKFTLECRFTDEGGYDSARFAGASRKQNVLTKAWSDAQQQPQPHTEPAATATPPTSPTPLTSPLPLTPLTPLTPLPQKISRRSAETETPEKARPQLQQNEKLLASGEHSEETEHARKRAHAGTDADKAVSADKAVNAVKAVSAVGTEQPAKSEAAPRSALVEDLMLRFDAEIVSEEEKETQELAAEDADGSDELA